MDSILFMHYEDLNKFVNQSHLKKKLLIFTFQETTKRKAFKHTVCIPGATLAGTILCFLFCSICCYQRKYISDNLNQLPFQQQMEKEVKQDSRSRKPIIKEAQLVSTAFERFNFWKKLLHKNEENIQMTKTQHHLREMNRLKQPNLASGVK